MITLRATVELLDAGGEGSGHYAHLKRMGIHNLQDLKDHVSRHRIRYAHGNGKEMSHHEVLTKLVGPAADQIMHHWSKKAA